MKKNLPSKPRGEKKSMKKLRKGRTLSKLCDLGVDIKLHHTRSTDAVYWSPRFNSYVVVKEKGDLKVLSINGIGEIRWGVNMDCFPSDEDREAYRYFIQGTDGKGENDG